MEQVVSSSSTPTGGLLRLSGWVRLDGLWLGPLTATVAGILASGAFHWSWSTLLRAAVLLLLAELGWANLWWAAAGTDWASLRERWNEWPGTNLTAGVVPYAQPGSPAGRLARWWTDLRHWGQAELWPRRGVQLGAVLMGLPLALAFSFVLGPKIALLTLAVLAISQMVLFFGPADGNANPFAQAAVEIGIPWLGGVLVFGHLTWPCLALGIGLVVAYAGLVLTSRDKSGGLWLAVGQGTMVVSLAAVNRPLAAAGVGALYFPQLALLPWRPAGLGGSAAIRLAQWPFLAAMLLAATAL